MNEVKQAIHSAASLSAAFSEADLQANPILRYFHFAHLPDSLKEISGSFCALALRLLTLLPPSAERTNRPPLLPAISKRNCRSTSRAARTRNPTGKPGCAPSVGI